MSVLHEVKALSEQLGIETGSLGDDISQLSYKARYPVEKTNDNRSVSATMINDLEALKEHPEIEEGYHLENPPKTLWAVPSKDASAKKVVAQLAELLAKGEEFLTAKVIPVLENASKENIT
jgi:hypothetical protein